MFSMHAALGCILSTQNGKKKLQGIGGCFRKMLTVNPICLGHWWRQPRKSDSKGVDVEAEAGGAL